LSSPVARATTLSNGAVAMAARLIANFEFARLWPYLNAGGTTMIGYGTTLINGHPVTLKTPLITRGQALIFLQRDLQDVVAALEQDLRVTIPDWQAAALMSLMRNVGIVSVLSSALIPRINEGIIGGAANQFLTFESTRETADFQSRRKIERDIFLGMGKF
jgi:lysozyme